MVFWKLNQLHRIQMMSNYYLNDHSISSIKLFIFNDCHLDQPKMYHQFQSSSSLSTEKKGPVSYEIIDNKRDK